jgi:hypothetical protein
MPNYDRQRPTFDLPEPHTKVTESNSRQKGHFDDPRADLGPKKTDACDSNGYF